jgi:hypothetical protein
VVGLSERGENRMASSFEEHLARGKDMFMSLSSEKSAVRGVSEAVKSNKSRPHDIERADKIFNTLVHADVDQLGVVAERLKRRVTKQKKKIR